MFLCVLVALFSTSPLYAQTTLETGLSTSVNMGERPGVYAGLRIETRGPLSFENLTAFDSSQKIEGGWSGGETFVVRAGGCVSVLTGGDFRYRDGGSWVKKTVWALVGVSWRRPYGELRLVYSHPAYESEPNHVHSLHGELFLRQPRQRVGLRLSEGFYLYRDYTGEPLRRGWSHQLLVSVRLSAAPAP